MTNRKRWIVLSTGLVGIGAVSLAAALPAPAACLAISAYGFKTASERLLVPANSSQAEQMLYKDLLRQARGRIENIFGKPDADPLVVFFNDPRAFWPLDLNLYGQAPTIGGRACLIIGPEGQDVDIVAHEFMHTEMHHRVGSWNMLREVPAWFDEGVAMQVDYRKRYDMNREQLPDSTYVRKLVSYKEFSRGQSSYAAAKREVNSWLAVAGTDTLYARLDRLRRGDPFARVIEQ